MRTRIGLILSILLLTCSVFFIPQSAKADVNDFVINDFHGRYELFNDVPEGRLETTETIKLTFSDNNHGILRALPETYKNRKLKLKIISVMRDGVNEQYVTSRSNGNLVLKIGDPARTITGQHTYQIAYQSERIITGFDNHDEWYWDINGNDWNQPFEKVSADIVYPAGWQTPAGMDAKCFTGQLGATTQNCSVTKTADGLRLETTMPLLPRENVTIVAAAQSGLFKPYDTKAWLSDNLLQLVGLAIGLAGAIAAFMFWFRYGRDPRGRGVIVPQYEPPANLTPADVGVLTDFNFKGRDIAASLVGLAIRGYLRFVDDNAGVPDKKPSLSLEFLPKDASSLSADEAALLHLLSLEAVGGRLSLQRLSATASQSRHDGLAKIQEQILAKLRDSYGLIDKTAKGPIAWMIGAGIAFMILLFLTKSVGWGWVIGCIIAAGSFVGFGIFMKRRSLAGVAVLEQVKGLKLYLNTAEKERLKMMESVDRPYAPPSQTIEFFEQLLPYAIALGVEESWARQFKDIYRTPPDWYGGSLQGFNSVYLASALSSTTDALGSSFSAPSSSGSSGFSGGGGSSGGGGGGGGGGGW